jgi:stearoyl-CoA desaturase (delta-9 desaturase)
LSIRWYEFDIGWLYIRILAALGLAQVKKVAPRPRLGTLRPVVDFDTLQAVIVNRYDVLSQLRASSLKQVYREELDRLQDGNRFKGLKRWLAADAGAVPQEHARTAGIAARREPGTETAYAMRQELAAVWERSNVSREQLLQALQDWCERAENSGVRQLQELSMRLRSYALA